MLFYDCVWHKTFQRGGSLKASVSGCTGETRAARHTSAINFIREQIWKVVQNLYLWRANKFSMFMLSFSIYDNYSKITKLSGRISWMKKMCYDFPHITTYFQGESMRWWWTATSTRFCWRALKLYRCQRTESLGVETNIRLSSQVHFLICEFKDFSSPYDNNISYLGCLHQLFPSRAPRARDAPWPRYDVLVHHIVWPVTLCFGHVLR